MLLSYTVNLFLFESYAAVSQFSLIPMMNSPVRCVIILQGYLPSPFVDLSIDNRSVSSLLIIITAVFLNSNDFETPPTIKCL